MLETPAVEIRGPFHQRLDVAGSADQRDARLHKRVPIADPEHLQEAAARGIHRDHATVSVQAFGASNEGFRVTLGIVRVVPPVERPGVGQQVERLAIKRLAAQHQAHRVVGFETEVFGHRRTLRQTLAPPSRHRIVARLEVEERKTVGVVAEQGCREPLLVGHRVAMLVHPGAHDRTAGEEMARGDTQ